MAWAEMVWRVLGEEHGAVVAQYAVPLGYRVRVVWYMNLRQAIHIIELRSAKQGHPSYRRFAQNLYGALVAAAPWLHNLIRVDLNESPLAREGGTS